MKRIATLIILWSSLLLGDVVVTKTVSMMQDKHSTNETMELLLQKAKREAANEIFGDFITSATNVENGRLSNDSILAIVVGKIHVKGTPKYQNGESFGETKVTITAYATDEEISNAKDILNKRVEALNKAEKDSGVIVSNDFKGVIKTNKGSRNDIFYAGDEVEIYVLLNRTGYYYVLGKMNIDGEEQTYILDIEEATGMDKFVGHVSGENSNKWISLGAFEVEAPFGVENLQLIASSKPFESLPQHYYDDKYGYYFLDKKNETRGLKKRNNKTAQISKSDLKFTTMKVK